MRSLLIIALSTLCFSCSLFTKKTEESTYQAEEPVFTEVERKNISMRKRQEGRKLSFVAQIDKEIWGFFSDSTVTKTSIQYDLTKRVVEYLEFIDPSHGYAMTAPNELWIDGKEVLYTEREGETVWVDMDNGRKSVRKSYTWLMKDGKWLTEVHPDFVSIPNHEAKFDFGIRMMMNGTCYDSYDLENNSEPKDEYGQAMLEDYQSAIRNVDADDWYILSYAKDDKQFYVTKTDVDTTCFYWDCGGYDMFSVSPANVLAGEGLAFIAGVDSIGEGRVESHFHRQTFVEPGKPYHFVFGSVEYTLRSEGILVEAWNNGEELDAEGRINNASNYDRYQLFLESEGKEQLLLAIESFSDQYVEIKFIGDIDGDGKPDFIFETATWYENQELTLFLSSKAERGELVKLVARDGYSMAC